MVAEKLEALTALGLLNSRMKDFYDLALLSRMYSFDGATLTAAIAATFGHRGTMVESEPVGLTAAFHGEPARAIQWRAFVRRSRFPDQPGELRRLIDDIRRFAIEPLAAVAERKTFNAVWLAGGHWERDEEFSTSSPGRH